MGFASLLPHRAVTAQQFLICGITGNREYGNQAVSHLPWNAIRYH